MIKQREIWNDIVDKRVVQVEEKVFLNHEPRHPDKVLLSYRADGGL